MDLYVVWVGLHHVSSCLVEINFNKDPGGGGGGGVCPWA